VPAGTAFPFWEKTTNLRVPSGYREAGLRGNFQDTNEIIFNPVTNEFEVLVTSRNANFDGSPKEVMTLSLWSISASQLINSSTHAEFTYRGTLLTRRHRKGTGAPEGYDGFHVAGTVLHGGVQQIFFYSGYNKTGDRVAPGAGIFQLRR